MLLRGLIGGLAVMLCVSSAGAAPSQRSQVLISVVTCARDGAESPKAFVLGDGSLRRLSAVSRRVSSSVWQIGLPAPSLHFQLLLRTKHCVAWLPVTVLPHHSRTLLAVLGNRGYTGGADNSLYGLAPKGSLVYLVLRDDYRLVSIGAMDDGGYYMEGLPAGQYVLRLDVGPGNLRDYPVEISKGQKVFSISIGMIRE